jgi:O-antigen ligase
MTGSRMVIAATILLLIVDLVLFKSKFVRVRVWILLTVGTVAVLIIVLNPYLRYRFSESASLPSQPAYWNALNMRLAIWKCNWDIIKDHPLIGIGAGSHKVAANSCLEQYDFYKLYSGALNPHSQYMEYQLIGGAPLIIAWLFSLGLSFKRAFERKDRVHFGLLALFVMVCLTESLLGVYRGIFFFSFFNSIFYMNGSE